MADVIPLLQTDDDLLDRLLDRLRDRPDVGRPPSLAAAVAPLLVGAREAGRLAGVSEATWWRLHSAARVPNAVKVGNKTMWRVADIAEWVRLGCPSRRELEARQAQARRQQKR